MLENTVEISIKEVSDTAEDVRRCLQVLLGTRAGTLALDRDFGLEWDFLDMPLEAAQAACSAELIAKIERYEPRAVVKRVTFTGNSAGLLKPKIEVELNV
jgi:phage baseplate assembly protein W